MWCWKGWRKDRGKELLTLGMSITKGSRVGWEEEWQKGQGRSRRKSGKRSSTSHQFGSTLVLPSFREKLPSAVQVFCRFGALKKKELCLVSSWLRAHRTAVALLRRWTGQICAQWAAALSDNKGTMTLLTRTHPSPEQTPCMPGSQITSAGSQIRDGFCVSPSLSSSLLWQAADDGEMPVWWGRVRGQKAEMELRNLRWAKPPEHLIYSQCASSHLAHALQPGDEQHFQQFLAWASGISHHQVSLRKGDLESLCQRRVPADVRGTWKLRTNMQCLGNDLVLSVARSWLRRGSPVLKNLSQASCLHPGEAETQAGCFALSGASLANSGLNQYRAPGLGQQQGQAIVSTSFCHFAFVPPSNLVLHAPDVTKHSELTRIRFSKLSAS